MDLAIFILSQPDRERQILYNIAYMWSIKKKDTKNELIYKTEVDSQTQEKIYGYQMRKGDERRDKLVGAVGGQGTKKFSFQSLIPGVLLLKSKKTRQTLWPYKVVFGYFKFFEPKPGHELSDF